MALGVKGIRSSHLAGDRMDTHTPNAHVVCFGAFELDCDSGELRRHGQKIRLPDQSFQILKALLAGPEKW